MPRSQKMSRSDLGLSTSRSRLGPQIGRLDLGLGEKWEKSDLYSAKVSEENQGESLGLTLISSRTGSQTSRSRTSTSRLHPYY